MTAPAPGRPCTLRLSLGESEACPGPSCELWHDGGCVLDPVDLELRSSPALAGYLLELQATLERAATADEATCARSLFHRRLNAEQAAGG
jgi:hypothetical protein